MSLRFSIAAVLASTAGVLAGGLIISSPISATTCVPATSSWTPHTPIGLGPRGGGGSQSSAYDSINDRLIVFGGFDPFSSGAESADAWVLENATGSGGTPTWKQLAPRAPNGLPRARVAHSAIYDACTNRLIIFGGGHFDAFHFNPLFDDVWVLTNANGLGGDSEWVPRFPIGGPPAAREGHGAIYSQDTNDMIIFGGGDNGIMSIPNDMWVLRNANDIVNQPTWVPVGQAGAVPSPLQHFASGYDTTSNTWVVAGGCCHYTNRSRAADPATALPMPAAQWMNLSPAGMLPPIGDALTYGYDSLSDRLIVHGIQPGGNSNATWVLADASAVGGAPTWFNTIPAGAPGSPPAGAVLVGSGYNASRKILIHALNRIDGAHLIPEVWVLAHADGCELGCDSSSTPRFPLATGDVRPVVTGRFGGSATDVKRSYVGHLGEDYRAQDGTPVYAAGCGRVCSVGESPSWGRYVVVEHCLENGLKRHSLYAHLQQAFVVERSDVDRGQLVGCSGHTGGVPPHLHFGVLDDKKCKPDKGYSGSEFPDTSVSESASGRTYFNPSLFIEQTAIVGRCK